MIFGRNRSAIFRVSTYKQQGSAHVTHNQLNESLPDQFKRILLSKRLIWDRKPHFSTSDNLPFADAAVDSWYGLGVGWVMGRNGVSDEIRGITNGKVLTFDGIEAQLPISGPVGGDVLRIVETIVVISGAMSITSSA